ncbi:hypothetical protein QBC38DRAFT_491180 [Podospora fimiseda]|uniref:Uncharacterized protein n=1 Tax=Podospora fimiseda TaxID=252190 RepID=A0AAN6YSN7_9PEZI|nr:hypothetical protein QBC38DRAFT_491180 [Podospora fimiseda]
MVNQWQQWLSPRPQPTPHPPGSTMRSFLGTALYEFLYEEDGRFVVKETHYANNKLVREGKSGPPLHIHVDQTEYFQVLQGALGAARGNETVRFTKDDGILVIPKGIRHRFWADSSINETNEDLVFKCWADPYPMQPGFDESFLRNFIGYMRDCTTQGIQPSIFSIALIGLSSGTLFICPPFYIPVWILKSVQYVLGDIIGRRILGYQEAYPEYCNAKTK